MEIFFGLIAGFFTSIGVGGGMMLILFLTLFLGISQPIAQATNLICFIPASLISIFYNIRKKNINIKDSFPILIFGILGALIGSYIAKSINIYFLKKIFGCFLLVIAFYEVYDFFSFIKNQ